MDRIYVSIPCLHDPEIFKTIEDIYNNASNPDRVDVSVAFFLNTEEEDIKNKIKNLLPDKVRADFYLHSNFMGVGAGRRLAYKNYEDQQYYLQIDSHTMLENEWDVGLISYLEEAKNLYGSKSVLTGYLPAYDYFENEKRYISRKSPMYPICVSDWDQLNENSGGSSHWKLSHKNIPQFLTDQNFYLDQKLRFELCNKFCANFIFSSKNFAKDYLKFIPFDFLFFEEEFLMSVEMLDSGYIPIYPNFNIGLAHLYLQNINSGQTRNTLNPTEEDIYSSEENIKKYLFNNMDKVLSFYEYANIDKKTNLCKNYMGIPNKRS